MYPSCFFQQMYTDSYQGWVYSHVDAQKSALKRYSALQIYKCNLIIGLIYPNLYVYKSDF